MLVNQWARAVDAHAISVAVEKAMDEAVPTELHSLTIGHVDNSNGLASAKPTLGPARAGNSRQQACGIGRRAPKFQAEDGVEIRIRSVSAKCSGCGASDFVPPQMPFGIEDTFICSSCQQKMTYGELLDSIGEEAMRQAERALDSLRDKNKKASS
jgi:hypothetical protein